MVEVSRGGDGHRGTAEGVHVHELSEVSVVQFEFAVETEGVAVVRDGVYPACAGIDEEVAVVGDKGTVRAKVRDPAVRAAGVPCTHVLREAGDVHSGIRGEGVDKVRERAGREVQIAHFGRNFRLHVREDQVGHHEVQVGGGAAIAVRQFKVADVQVVHRAVSQTPAYVEDHGAVAEVVGEGGHGLHCERASAQLKGHIDAVYVVLEVQNAAVAHRVVGDIQVRPFVPDARARDLRQTEPVRAFVVPCGHLAGGVQGVPALVRGADFVYVHRKAASDILHVPEAGCGDYQVHVAPVDAHSGV